MKQLFGWTKEVLVMTAILVLLPAFSFAQAPAEKPLVPNFTLESNQGSQVSLSDYAGRVVVLKFWASWCPPCRAEMPEFKKLHEHLADSEEAVLLMLNQIDGRRETVETGAAYLWKTNIHFSISLITGR